MQRLIPSVVAGFLYLTCTGMLFAETKVEATPGSVVISEIMYHPSDPSEAEVADGFDDADAFEFIELMNISQDVVSLAGCEFNEGIAFRFPGIAQLKPGERAVLVKDKGAFAKRYGSSARVMGAYDGSLKNSGEKVTLDGKSEEIVSVNYKDSKPWPESADGLGFSLVLLAPETNPSANQSVNWQASNAEGGSPGAGDRAVEGGVVINEILTHTDLPDVDAIELYNPTDAPVDVSGWFLTDDPADEPTKYAIVSGSVIPAGGYLVIKGDNDDNPANNEALPAERFARAFSLSSHGEAIHLFAADGQGQRTGYSHGFEFKAGANGVSFGRHLNSAGREQFPPQSAVTLGAANAGPREAHVVISEVMYHPAEGDDSETEEEFVEIWNRSKNPVPLFSPMHPENTWQMTGWRFTFPPKLTLQPNEVAVVTNADPKAFRVRHEIPDAVKVFQTDPEEEAVLSNKGEWIRLLRPDLPDTDAETGETVVPMLEVDAVRYRDDAPWPEAADGEGPSLERKRDASYTNDPASWKASDKDGGTPGSL